MRRKEEVFRKLRSEGLKLTPQRIAVIEMLENCTSHPSAEEIYREVSKKYSTISYATIYKTLETLHQLGEIKEINIEPGRMLYDPYIEPHHHLRCIRCGKVRDVSIEEIPFPRISPAVRKKYAIVDISLHIYGLCEECAKIGMETVNDRKQKEVEKESGEELS